MSKNKLTKKEEMFDFEDYEEFDDSSNNELMAGFVSGMLEASNNQAKIALELTKLIAEKTPSDKIDEEFVFSTFKKSTKVVSENQSLPELLKAIGMA